MKNGNFTNAVLRRSVYGLLGKTENTMKPGIGREAGGYVMADKSKLIQAAATGRYAVYRAAAKVSAGAQAVAMALQLRFPKSYEESDVKETIRMLRAQCELLNVAVTAVDVCGDGEISRVSITAVCTGLAPAGFEPVIAPNQDIIAVGSIGAEGVRILCEQYRDKLEGRFTQLFCDTAMGSESGLCVTKACSIIRQFGAYIIPMGEGGIFAALWNLAEYGGVGLCTDLKKFPVRQEVIEVCDYLGKNIYELSSFGSLLVTSDKGYDIINALEEKNIKAVVIGRTTESNDKIINNDGEIRFLDTPKRDEIYN